MAENISFIEHKDQNFSKELVVLIYGSFYGGIMSPDLVGQYCSDTPKYRVVRSESCLPHDIVILHFTFYNIFMKKCSKSPRKTKKVMIISSMEPAWSTKTEIQVQPSHKNNYYLLSESFHQDSSVRITYYEWTQERGYVNLFYLPKQFSSRKHLAGTVMNICISPASIRLEYITELEKYFDIDKRGNCFGKKISEEEKIEMLKEVMFYISFENSVCDDYITEEYCRPIEYGAIPIVMSSPKNILQLIPGSYINVFDFKSAKQLADHLLEITNKLKIYESYFEWKKRYNLDRCGWKFSTCEMINQASQVGMRGMFIEDGEKTLTNERNCMTEPQLRQNLFGVN